MASKTNISDYRFSIFINNDDAKRKLVEMEKTMMGYEQELKNLEREGKKNTAEYKEREAAMTKLRGEMVQQRKEAGLQALSLKELKALQMALRNEFSRSIPGTEHRKRLEKELQAVGARITEVNIKAKSTGMTLGQIADGFNRYFAMITAGIAAFAGMALSIKNLITAQGELSDSLANIRKTTGMTAVEVEKLNKQLGKIDTRTSRQDLREMAVVAGQLGIAKDDVYAFVESVDKLNVALGDEIKGGAEEVATKMGTLRNVLTDMKSKDISTDMLLIGNAINTLGAAGFATAPVMVDFAGRIGGVGISLGLTSNEVLGLSATLQELNVNTERGGTAVTKILQKMTTNTDEFAKIAGMGVKEFTDLVNSDLYGAFVKVLEGSKQGGQSATLLAGIIKDLEVQGAGASEVFAKLGTNTQMLAEKVNLAGSALQNTDSITSEFNIKNATLGAVLAKLSKEFYSLITMPGVTEFFKNQVMHVVDLVHWFKDLPQLIDKYRVLLIALSGATMAWIAAKTRSLQVLLLNNLTMKEGILLKIKDQVVMAALIAKEELLTIWKGKGTVATKLATTAQYAWNTAMKANPLGLVITAVTALGAAIKAYNQYNSKAIQNEKFKAETMSQLEGINSRLTQSYEQYNGQIRNLNRLSIQERADLQDKIEKNIKLAESELLVMQARQQQIGVDANYATLWQKMINGFGSLANPAGAAIDNAVDAFKNSKEAMEGMNDGIDNLKKNIESLKETSSGLKEITQAEAIADAMPVQTDDQQQEKMANYQIALRNAIKGSEDYARIQGKIKELNKEIGNDSYGQQLEKNAEKLQNYLDSIKIKLAQTSAQLINNERERELKMAELDYQSKLNEIKGQSEEENALRRNYYDLYHNQREEIFRKYSEKEINAAIEAEKQKWEEIITAEVEGSAQWFLLKQALLDKQQEWELSNAELTAEEMLAIIAKYDKKRQKLQEDFVNGPTKTGSPSQPETTTPYQSGSLVEKSGIDESDGGLGLKLQLLEEAKDQEIKIAGESAEQRKQIENDYYDAVAQLITSHASKLVDLASYVVNQLSSIYQAVNDYENAQLRKDENANNKKKANFKSQLDNKQISQKKYDQEIIKLDTELDEKKKALQIKQAKRQREISIAQAIIGVAQAAISGFNTTPFFPVGLLMGALALVLGGVQLGYILSTPIPEAAKGRYTVMGESGQVYEDLPYIGAPKTGLYERPFIGAEKGREIVIDNPTTENLMMNHPHIIRAINMARVPQRAAGSYIDAGGASAGLQVPTVITVSDPAQVSATNRLSNLLERGIEAKMSYDHWKNEADKVNQIESDITR